MIERVSPLDASLLFLDRPNTPMHVGSVMIFEEPTVEFGQPELAALVRQRLAFAPRYRQRIKSVPFGVARPVWIDDVHFDIGYHVRRTVLPKPGSAEQLDELVGRMMGRPLDRERPLWEIQLVEGLAGNRFAIVTKTHQALVDGMTSIDLLQVILDPTPDASPTPASTWAPAPEPSGVELLSAALTESLVHPAHAVEAVRSTATSALAAVNEIGSWARGAVGSALSIARPAPSAALQVEVGPRRRFATAQMPFHEVRDLHRSLNSPVNDVLLAILTGALRNWLMSRGVPITGRSQLRAVVPFSTNDPASPVSAFFLDLPTGEPDPVVRLRQIGYETVKFQDVAQLIGAQTIINAVGFGPATLHAAAARLASNISSRTYNLAVTNVPGPQTARYLGGARLLASYPVMPLTPSQSLTIGLTSYDGSVCVGINADFDAVPDLHVLVDDLHEAVAELRDAASAM